MVTTLTQIFLLKSIYITCKHLYRSVIKLNICDISNVSPALTPCLDQRTHDQGICNSHHSSVVIAIQYKYCKFILNNLLYYIYYSFPIFKEKVPITKEQNDYGEMSIKVAFRYFTRFSSIWKHNSCLMLIMILMYGVYITSTCQS